MGLTLEGQVVEARRSEKNGKTAALYKVLCNGGGPVSLITVYDRGEPKYKAGDQYKGHVQAKDDFVFAVEGGLVQEQTKPGQAQRL